MHTTKGFGFRNYHETANIVVPLRTPIGLGDDRIRSKAMKVILPWTKALRVFVHDNASADETTFIKTCIVATTCPNTVLLEKARVEKYSCWIHVCFLEDLIDNDVFEERHKNEILAKQALDAGRPTTEEATRTHSRTAMSSTTRVILDVCRA